MDWVFGVVPFLAITSLPLAPFYIGTHTPGYWGLGEQDYIMAVA